MLRHHSRRLLGFFLQDPALFLRYIWVGAASALIEFTLFTVTYQVLGWPLMAANMFALSLALLLNFTSHKNWTFRARGGLPRQAKLYLVMQAVSAVLNNALVYLLIGYWAWYPPAAKIVQIGLVFAWNFSFCKLVVFAGRRPIAGGPS